MGGCVHMQSSYVVYYHILEIILGVVKNNLLNR